MKKNLFNILSSGLQAVAIQILGVAFFYILSVNIAKEDFGVVGWANAVSMFVVTLLSFGMEQVVVRRVASSKSSNWAAGAFLFHAFTGSVIMLIALFLFSRLVSSQSALYTYLPLFFTAQAITYVTAPLKQFLNARQKFTPYAIVSMISNIGKILMLIYLLARKQCTVDNIALILIIAGIFEFIALALYLINNRSLTFTLKFRFLAYRKLIKESLPQYLSVIFDSSLSKIDWILLGMLSSNAITADYTFAYRAYDIAKLPVMIMGPIILAKFSKSFSIHGFDEEKKRSILSFYRVETVIAVLIVVMINILWTPIVGLITQGKYGQSDELMFLIISICLPFHFLINLLWTLVFSARKYRAIAKITMIVAITNLLLNVVLIPRYGGIGAALAYVSSTVLQAILFYKTVTDSIIKLSPAPLVIIVLLGAGIFILGSFLPIVFSVRLAISVVCLLVGAIVTRQVNLGDIKFISSVIRR